MHVSPCCTMYSKLLVVFSWLLLLHPVYGQLQTKPPGIGTPHVMVFTPSEYHGHSKSTSIDQDKEGIIYIANEIGVIVFDGSRWEVIELPGKVAATAVKVGDNGRIYVGGRKEFGFLQKGFPRNYHYTSLKDSLQEPPPTFKIVTDIHAKDDEVLFVTGDHIYSFNGDKVKERLATDGGGFLSFEAGEKLYLWQSGEGLKTFYDQNVQSLANGDKLANYIIRGILPFDEQRLLIAGLSQGLLLFDGVDVQPFRTEVDNELKRSQIYSTCKIGRDTYAIATREMGIFVINKEGKLLDNFTMSSGLPTNETLRVFLDAQKGLWVLTMNGIARLEINSPVTFFSNELGIDGSVQKMIRYEGRLYVGTSVGLFYVQGGAHPAFKRIEQVKVGCNALVVAGDKLLVGGPYGFYMMHHDHLEPITPADAYVKDILSSQFTPDLVIAGGFKGLMALVMEEERFRWINIPGQDRYGQVYALAEDEHGNIWMAASGGLYRLSGRVLRKDSLSFTVVEKKSVPPGLDLAHSRLYDTKTGVYLVSQGTLWKCDDLVHPVKYLHNKRLDMRVAGLKEEPGGNLWIYSDNAGVFEYGIFDGAKYDWQNTQLLALCKSTFNDIYPEGEVVWFGGAAGLVRYDKGISPVEKVPRALITGVISKGVNTPPGPVTKQRFPFQQNSLDFHFSIPSYDYLENNKYQYWLEGFDSHWSVWTHDNTVNYNNLWEGDYTFKLRAKDAYGNMTGETVYQFAVLPPWYRSWIAYTSYSIAIGLALFCLVKCRSRQLTRDKERLEKAVEQRTEEIKNQTHELSLQAKQLVIQAEKLREADKRKSRFFANVSHEFRTPLTLILEPLERKLSRQQPSLAPQDRQDLLLMQRNAKRLHELINQLLDLAKLEAGKMRLKVDIGNLGTFFQRIAASFQELSAREEIHFTYTMDELGQAYFDEEKLEKIVYNLLSNAFKFTSKSGHVTMQVKMEFANKLNTHILQITIFDTGLGIPSESLGKLFERFYQVDSSSTKENDGSGIGLALTKELVELHRGKIQVKTQQGKGSSFRVEIPIERLNPLQVSENDNQFINRRLVQNLTGSRKENRHLLLVVEDNLELRYYIKKFLSIKYDVLVAADGLEGLQLAQELIPDVVITDIMMPQVDGIELTRKIKKNEQTSHIPVIILTARSDDQSRMEGLNVGADEYVSKPFDMNELELRISNLIEQQEKIRAKLKKELLTEPAEAIVENRDEEFLLRAARIVEDHIPDHQFNVTGFQQQMGMSRMQLHRKLKALTGQSSGEFIKTMRMKRALDIFQKADDINISEVAYQVGFVDPSYFTKCFKAYFKFTPSEMVNKHDS